MQSTRMPAAITAIGGEVPRAAADRRSEKADGSMPIARSLPSLRRLPPSASFAVNTTCKAKDDLRTRAAHASDENDKLKPLPFGEIKPQEQIRTQQLPKCYRHEKGSPPSERPFAWFVLIKHRLPSSRRWESHPWEPPSPA